MWQIVHSSHVSRNESRISPLRVVDKSLSELLADRDVYRGTTIAVTHTQIVLPQSQLKIIGPSRSVESSGGRKAWQ